VLEALEAPPRLRVAARVLGWPFKWLGLSGDPALPPVTRALTALGPAYIKFGQVLSTRPDIVGDELATQLKYLQDKLPPFPTDHRQGDGIEAELGQSGRRGVFRVLRARRGRLDRAGPPRALADGRRGCRGQGAAPGDRARLPQGHRRLLPSPPAGSSGWRRSSRRLRPTDVIAHFEGVVMGELDLRLECSAASEFAANTAKGRWA
jgi:ubiquinone biosynthesis protein